ncbi:MAG: hypothetical protein AAFU67_13825, partial [Bacteroidota bacterium]
FNAGYTDELALERINWVLCNGDATTNAGRTDINGAIWYFTNTNSSCNGLCNDAITAVQSVQGGIQENMIFYLPSVSGVQPFIEGYCVDNPTVDGGVPPEDFSYGCLDGVFVDIYASSISCNSTPQAITNIPNSSEVFQVVAEIVYKNGQDPGSSVTVDASDGVSYILHKVNVPGNSSNVRVYRGLIPTGVSFVSYTDASGNACTNNSNNNTGLQSLVTYAFRNTTVERSSTGTFTGLSSYNDIETFTIPVPTDDLSRNIDVVIPISEMTTDGRYLTVRALIDGVEYAKETIFGPSSGCCVELLTLPLENVAGTVNSIVIEIDTRNDQLPGYPTLNGQSYVISGTVYADVECTKIDDCDLTFRARGDCGGEEVELQINGTTVATYILLDHFAIYAYSGFNDGDNVVFEYVNNATVGGCDRDFILDYVTVGTETYQTETDAIRNGPGSGQELGGNGSFDFGSLVCEIDPCDNSPLLANITCAEDPLLTRTASNSTQTCSPNTTYGVFFASNGLVSNYTSSTRWPISSASFVENANGTAIFTAHATDPSNNNLGFDIIVNFRGRTFIPPTGSPKENTQCVGNLDNSDWY